MHFEAFSSSELAAYLRGIPAVNARLGDDSELEVVEVGDGNLNYGIGRDDAGILG